MDIGVQTYTEYSDSPDVISYMIDKDLLDSRIGLIHSHNHMSTFFSATDTATLKQEALNHDHFVSLIVNNRRMYSAAMTTFFKTKTKCKFVEDYSYATFDGVLKTGQEEYEDEVEKEIILWSKLNVILDIEEYKDDEIIDRIAEIKELKSKAAAMKAQAEAQKKAANYQQKTIPPNTGAFKTETGSVRVIKQDPPTDKVIPKQKEIEFETGDLSNYTTFDPNSIPDLHVDPKIVKHLMAKIVTGSILVPENNRIDLKQFISSMDRTLPDIFEDTDDYDFFISCFIESIIFTIKDPKIVGYSDREMAHFLANDLILGFAEMPSNEYVEIITDNLSNFLLDSEEDGE